MTIETPLTKITALGNGAATTFSFSPVVLTVDTDLEVYLVDNLGVQTLLSEGTGPTQYTVTPLTAWPCTGSISYPGAGGTVLPTGWSLIMNRVVVIQQTMALENQGGYFPDTQEAAFDYLTMIALQLQEQLDRAILVPISDTVSIATLTADIIALGAIITNLTAIASDLTNINAVAADLTALNAIQADLTALNALAADLTNVNAVEAALTAINAVATIAADVTTVAGISADVTAVSTIHANVTTLAGISTDVTAVSTIHANVTTVAGISANVTTVAGISANVTTVAGISANVTAVAGDLTNIDTCATNIGSINTAAGALGGNQTANYGFLGPTSGSAAPATFRALVSADIPSNVVLAGSPTTTTQAGNDSSTKIATTAFVAGVLAAVEAGLEFKSAVSAMSATNLTGTFVNSGGVGDTLTNSGAQAAFATDGQTLAVGSRVLLAGQTTAYQNGIYTVTVAGTGATNWVLTRATDYNAAADVHIGDLVPVQSGTLYGGSVWLQTTAMATMDVTSITFIEYLYPKTSFLLASNNLSDVTAATARTNLGVADATATTAGRVPTPPNNTTTFLRGDATFAAPPATGLSSKIITFTRNPSVANGSVSYTGVGFTPTSIKFLVPSDPNLAAAGGGVGGSGFVDSSKNGYFAQNPYAAATLNSGNYAVIISNGNDDGGTTYATATVSSYDSDGFTLAWTKTGSPTNAALTVYALCEK